MTTRTKTILTCAGISGAVTIGGYFLYMGLMDGKNESGYSSTEYLGYLVILLSCIPIFFGVKSIRNKVYNGHISFGKALWNGLIIAFLGSLLYTIGWYIYTSIHPEIYDMMMEAYIKNMKAHNMPGAEIAKAQEQFQQMCKWLKNPLTGWIMTVFMEYMPVGLLVSLTSAAILRKKAAAA